MMILSLKQLSSSRIMQMILVLVALFICLLQQCATFSPHRHAMFKPRSDYSSRTSRICEDITSVGHYSSVISLKASRWEPPSDKQLQGDDGDGVAYSVELPKATGITWGSDLSFRFVYVQELEPNGPAAATGMVQKGDYLIGCGNTSLVAQDFNYVLSVLAETKNSANLTFFRGSKSQMLGSEVAEPSDTIVNVRVVQKGKPDRVLQCPGGTNLRTLLVGNGINVYRSLTRWTNCNGQQRCGTCIVEVTEGMEGCSQRTLDEEMVLQENPDTYRLSCITNVYSDITVEVLGPVGAAQWTR